MSRNGSTLSIISNFVNLSARILMNTNVEHTRVQKRSITKWFAACIAATVVFLLSPSTALASEAELKVPDLGSQQFLGMPGDTLLMIGLLVCALGLGFGM